MNEIKQSHFHRRYIIPMAAAFMLAFIANAWASSIHKIGVDGLACPFCAYGIEKQLTAIPGVKSAKASVKSGTVTVTMKDGASLSRGRAAQAVRDAGFSLRSFK